MNSILGHVIHVDLSSSFLSIVSSNSSGFDGVRTGVPEWTFQLNLLTFSLPIEK